MALNADEVVMPVDVAVKAHAVSGGADAGGKSFFFKQAQGSIDRVEGDGGNPLLDCGIEGFRTGVVFRRHQCPVNLCTLVSRLDSPFTTAGNNILVAVLAGIGWLHGRVLRP